MKRKNLKKKRKLMMFMPEETPEEKPKPTDWNVLVTAHRRESWKAAQQLKPFVKLRRTAFRDVLVGKAENVKMLLDSALEMGKEAPDKPPFVPAYSRIIPVEHVFEFEVENILEKLKEIMKGYAPRLSGKFDVRMERRGLKGQINSQEIANSLRDLVKELNPDAVLDMEEPDSIVIIETLGKVAGVILADKEMRQKYSFVRAD